MRTWRMIGRSELGIALVLALTLVLPVERGAAVRAAWGESAAPSAVAPSPRDIALGQDNTLLGNVVDEAGMPQANYEVWIEREGESPLRARTDATGEFRVKSLAPGIYRIDTTCGGGRFRIWEAKDAPASAPKSVLLVISAKAGN